MNKEVAIHMHLASDPLVNPLKWIGQFAVISNYAFDTL